MESMSTKPDSVLPYDLTSVLSDAIMPPNKNTKGKYWFLYNNGEIITVPVKVLKNE